MAFDLTPIVIIVVISLAVALLVLVILTATYLKSRRRLIESRREARVRRQERRVKFSPEVGAAAVEDAGVDDLPVEPQRPLYRPVHAFGIQNGNRTQRQIFLPPVSRGSVWINDLDQQQPADSAAFSWPQLPPVQEASSVYRPPLLTLQPLPEQTPQQRQLQPLQRIRDVVSDVEVSDGARRRRRVVYNDENDVTNWQENRNNNLVPVALPNTVPSFQAPVVILENPPRSAPDFQLERQMALQIPAVVSSSIAPVSAAPIIAVHRSVTAPVQLSSSSSDTPAALAVPDNVGTEAAEVSWSVVDNADGANGQSLSTSGYMQMAGRGSGGESSSSAAVFTRPVPALRQSLLAASAIGNFGGGNVGGGRRQFEDQEQSISMSSSGTVHLPVPAVRRSINATASAAVSFGGGNVGDGRRQFEDQEQSISMSSSGTVRFH